MTSTQHRWRTKCVSPVVTKKFLILLTYRWTREWITKVWCGVRSPLRFFCVFTCAVRGGIPGHTMTDPMTCRSRKDLESGREFCPGEMVTLTGRPQQKIWGIETLGHLPVEEVLKGSFQPRKLMCCHIHTLEQINFQANTERKSNIK
jgi:hypothetical protein